MNANVTVKVHDLIETNRMVWLETSGSKNIRSAVLIPQYLQMEYLQTQLGLVDTGS